MYFLQHIYIFRMYLFVFNLHFVRFVCVILLNDDQYFEHFKPTQLQHLISMLLLLLTDTCSVNDHSSLSLSTVFCVVSVINFDVSRNRAQCVLRVYLHSVPQNFTFLSFLCLQEILNNFQNSFTDRIRRKFAITLLL